MSQTFHFSRLQGCSMLDVCIGARCVHIFSTSLSNKLIKFCFYHILSTPAVCSTYVRAPSFSPSQLPTNVQMPVILLIATDKTIEKNSRKWTNGCRICKIKCLTLIFKSLDEIKWCDQIHSWSTSTFTFTYSWASVFIRRTDMCFVSNANAESGC